MILKSSGVHLLDWTVRTTKTLIPTGIEDFSLRNSFKYDPPPIRWSRKSQQPPCFGRHWKLLALLTTLNSCFTQGQSHFHVKSELKFGNHLRKYCSYQGQLQTDNNNNNDNSLTNSLIYLLLKIPMAKRKGPFDRLRRSPLSLVVLLRRAIADLVHFDNGIL